MRRMAKVLDALPGITQPHVVEPYATRDVLVQDRSHGTRLEAAYGTAAAPALARALLGAYVHQLFGAGVFHANPHPGNLFFLDDGRLCLHDFGSIGVLDPASRLALGGMVEAIAADDAEGVLDAAIAMGFFPPQVDRRSHVREIHLILAEMASRPLAQWSIAEAIWRVARIGQGAGFRLPAHLLSLIRTLFLVENTLRALDPDLDLLGTLSAQAAAIADDIAYDTHDIDDGLRAGLLSLDMLEAVPLPAGILGEVRSRHPGLDEVRTGHELMRRQITAMVEDAIATAQANLDEIAPRDVAAVHAAGRPVVAFSGAMAAAEKELKRFLYANLYRHPTVMAAREGADRIVADLFTRYFEHPAAMPEDHGREAEAADEAVRARHVADFIAGMTDTYAIKEHRRLFDRTPELG